MQQLNSFTGLSLLHLIQLSSPNLPLGGFTYSQGLEWAIKCGWVASVDEFNIWKNQFIHEQLIYVDWPILYRMYYSIKNYDINKFAYYIMRLMSLRETKELRAEERHRGRSIVRLMFQWSLNVDNFLLFLLQESGLASFAWLGFKWNIPLQGLALGYGYIIVENIIISGLKLVPFGQKVAQKLLMQSVDLLIPAWNKSCLVTDSELGSSFPMQSIASSCHETQEFRLFRS